MLRFEELLLSPVTALCTLFKLVLRSGESQGEYENWHRSVEWEVLDDQMTREQIDIHFLEVDKMRAMLDDLQTHPIHDGETP